MHYAKEIGDAVMLNRLHGVSNGDLVAVNARYHRKNCYTKYFKQNVVAKDRPAETHMILERVIDEYKSVIIGDSHVVLLSTIRNRYTGLADRCENVILF